MSIRVMSLAWELPLSSTEKLVLLALADCANDEGECWPSIATIGRKACIGERSVQRSIQSLKDQGHLTRIEVTGKGCRYVIHPRHSVTPATVSPVTDETSPPPQCHPTPATVSPKPSLNHQEPSKVKTQRARVMPEDWVPDDWPPGSKCGEITASWADGEYDTQVEHFTAHHRSKGSRFVDWQDAWKTWVLNSRKWNRGNGNDNRSAGAKHSGSAHGQRDNRDGVARALDRRLGLDDAPGPFGRRDAGAGEGPRAIAPPRVNPVF